MSQIYNEKATGEVRGAKSHEFVWPWNTVPPVGRDPYVGESAVVTVRTESGRWGSSRDQYPPARNGLAELEHGVATELE